MALDKVDVNDAINAAHQSEARQEDRLGDLVQVLKDAGHLDNLDIDPTDIFSAYVEKVTGKPLPGIGAAPRGTPSRRPHHALSSSAEDLHDQPVNEADLDDI
jgi:hypothetical protein